MMLMITELKLLRGPCTQCHNTCILHKDSSKVHNIIGMFFFNFHCHVKLQQTGVNNCSLHTVAIYIMHIKLKTRKWMNETIDYTVTSV